MKVPAWAPWFILGLWGVWLGAVVAHGLGANVWHWSTDFQEAGVFGDAFGSLGSLMAALAAAGALLTLRQQQEQSSVQNFEGNFFGLLDHFQNLVQATQAHSWSSRIDEEGEETPFLSHTFHGHQAFRALLDELRQKLAPGDFQNDDAVGRKYRTFYEEYQDDLGHYFRLLYHLFKMIGDRAAGTDAQKYYYAQLVRAHLSSSELILLAYNCISGEGRHKFVKYLGEYAVLHNAGFKSDDFGQAEEAFIRLKLPSRAFVSRSQLADAKALTTGKKEA